MNSVLRRASLTLRWGILGVVSGVLSCVMSQSHIIYVVREQKTLDHIVWPGIVFALVVILPISRWAGDSWLRTAAAVAASSAVYPVAWRIAVSGTSYSAALMIAMYAFAGFLGAFVLASVFLFGRPRWLGPACAVVLLGTLIGGMMGAHLRAAMAGVRSPLSAGDGLGLFMVLWQAAAGAALGRVAAGTQPATGGSDQRFPTGPGGGDPGST